MTIKLETVVKHFYEELENGKILGRKCPECGHVEFPPVYACNACGNYETEWYEISGAAQVNTLVLPAPLSMKPEYKNLGKFAYGEVELQEGTKLNAVIRGVSRKNKAELSAQLPLKCHASIFQREGNYKTVVFDLDE